MLDGREGAVLHELKQEKPGGQLLDSNHQMLLGEGQPYYFDKETGSRFTGRLVGYGRTWKLATPPPVLFTVAVAYSSYGLFFKANLKLPAAENDLNSGSI